MIKIKKCVSFQFLTIKKFKKYNFTKFEKFEINSFYSVKTQPIIKYVPKMKIKA